MPTSVALDQLFQNARTHRHWLDRPVSQDTLRQLYDLMKWGPTSANSSPLRVVFVTTPEAKAKLLPCVAQSKRERTQAAPVTAILAWDVAFVDMLPRLFPQADARRWFAGKDALIRETAFRNSSIQGGYFILAARALGLDCGPMSGFDAARVNAAFFAGTSHQANFLCNLGYGDASKLLPRSPRLTFDQACSIT